MSSKTLCSPFISFVETQVRSCCDFVGLEILIDSECDVYKKSKDIDDIKTVISPSRASTTSSASSASSAMKKTASSLSNSFWSFNSLFSSFVAFTSSFILVIFVIYHHMMRFEIRKYFVIYQK